jgi:5-methylcytosine-specific restriction endonuclease McrA
LADKPGKEKSDKIVFEFSKVVSFMSDYLNDRRLRKLGLKEPLPTRKEKKPIPKVSAKRKVETEQDKVTFKQDIIFYAEIWANSPHSCQSCGVKLPKEPLTLFFHHLLPKAKFEALRHVPENIMILCPDCHSQAETDLDKVPKVKARTEEAKRLLL